MRVIGSETNKSLESKVIQDFYDKFGAIPVGNGAFSFRWYNDFVIYLELHVSKSNNMNFSLNLQIFKKNSK